MSQHVLNSFGCLDYTLYIGFKPLSSPLNQREDNASKKTGKAEARLIAVATCSVCTKDMIPTQLNMFFPSLGLVKVDR
jgi:hypothetical protein